jgi:UDP-N-acetylmuramyl pentapeptide synthase
MSINSTILSFGAYNPFLMDTALKQTQLDAPLVVRGSHLMYWVVLACVVFAVYSLRSSRIADLVDAPFYKAGRLKWMTDAENLVRDSYNKVDKA